MAKASTNHTSHDLSAYGVAIEPAMYGGYTVESAANHLNKIRIVFAAFSTLDEALKWARDNMRRSDA